MAMPKTIEEWRKMMTPPPLEDVIRNFDIASLVSFIRINAEGFKRDSSPHMKNIMPIDADRLATFLDAIADNIERYVAHPAMERALPGVPMVRVLDEAGKEVARGWYAAYPETTYCVKEDYERNPPRLIEGVVCWQTTDWELPNRIGFRQVTAPHRIEVLPFDFEKGGAQ